MSGRLSEESVRKVLSLAHSPQLSPTGPAAASAHVNATTGGNHGGQAGGISRAPQPQNRRRRCLAGVLPVGRLA